MNKLADGPTTSWAVRVDMALGKPCVLTFKAMPHECFRERFSELKQLEHVFQRFVIQSVARNSFLQAPEVALEAAREDNLLHKRLRCATASLAVVKRRALPSRSSRRD